MVLTVAWFSRARGFDIQAFTVGVSDAIDFGQP